MFGGVGIGGIGYRTILQAMIGQVIGQIFRRAGAHDVGDCLLLCKT